MGKPAARLMDTTAHGGMVTGPGVPTVLIGKMPAATLGDMHICPMLTPGVPPIPHVGGPITLGSTGVFIGKKPAARMGDMCVCVGPPSTIILGCPTVLIGEAGSGSQPGSADAALAGKDAGMQTPKALEPYPLAESTAQPQNHAIDCAFQDTAGKPLSVPYEIKDPAGMQLKGTGSPEGGAMHGGYAQAGSFEVTVKTLKNAAWDKSILHPGDSLKLSAAAEGFPPGSVADLQIFVIGKEGTYFLLESFKADIAGNKVQSAWKLEPGRIPLSTESGGLNSVYGLFFMVSSEGAVAVSKDAPLRDFAEIELLDDFGKPIPDAEYELILCDGTIRSGKLDGSGHARAEDIPFGVYEVNFKQYPEVSRIPGA
jgi:uncharacterized Zn-binding protein involved in type VI secretion